MWSLMHTSEPLRVARVDAAGRVGHDQFLHAESSQHAHGEGDLVHAVSFVGVHATLHDGDGDAAEIAEDELAGVSGDGGLREAGDLGVGDRDRVLHLRGEAAQSRTQDDADARHGGVVLADVVCGGLGVGVEQAHAGPSGEVCRKQCGAVTRSA